MTKALTRCRMCGESRLSLLVDLGTTPPADRFMSEAQLSLPEPSFPLQVMQCQSCGLAQLSLVVSPDLLYCEDYPYESSTTRMGQAHWREFAQTSRRMFNLGKDDLVIDVGSNVGVLLQMFKNEGARVLGVDPAANIAAIANRNGIETIAAFFNLKTAREIRERFGAATVITATNVFAHVDDLHDLMAAVDAMLNERGVFIIEVPYFAELVRNLEYDTIYHEHLSYISLQPLVGFFDRCGMEIFDIQQRDIHGGSIRLFVRRKGSALPAVAPIVEVLLRSESESALHGPEVALRFADAVAANRRDLVALLSRLKAAGNRIAAVSAPAKGMTLLNYCGIGSNFLDYVTEKSALKIGRYAPGTRLEVVSDDALLRDRPDYVLLLAWNFADEIIRNLHAYAEAGGKFIIPIPTPRIVG